MPDALHVFGRPSALLVFAFSLALASLSAAMTAAPEPEPVTVIAHRGASRFLPEHTMVAWERALEMGADYLEQDLQMTRDGVLVVLHDETLDRTARGPEGVCTGPVIERTLDELRRCEVSSWKVEALRNEGRERAAAAVEALPPQRIPTLEEVFRRFGIDGSVRYYIETKSPGEAPGMEEALLELLAAHGLVPGSPDDRTVLVQSFSPESLRKIHATEPTLPLVQLVTERALEEMDREEALDRVAGYAVGLGPSWKLVTPELVQAAHDRGLVVHPWTVNEPERMEALIEAGVDGMFTDVPEVLVELRGRER